MLPSPGVFLFYNKSNKSFSNWICTGVVTWNLPKHCTIKAKYQNFTIHFAMSFDPLYPPNSIRKPNHKGLPTLIGCYSFTVSGPNSPSVWVSNFSPQTVCFWWRFLGAQFSDLTGGFRAKKLNLLPAQMKRQCFSKLLPISFWGNLFGTCFYWKCIF